MTMLSLTDYSYLEQASLESQKSKLNSRHGCVAVANGKIMGKGHNSPRTQSSDGFISNTCSCHAEVAAIRNLWHSCGCNTFGKYNKQKKPWVLRKDIQKSHIVYSKNRHRGKV